MLRKKLNKLDLESGNAPWINQVQAARSGPSKRAGQKNRQGEEADESCGTLVQSKAARVKKRWRQRGWKFSTRPPETQHKNECRSGKKGAR